MSSPTERIPIFWIVRITWLLASLVSLQCRPLDMYNQPKYEPYEPSTVFADGTSARHPPEGTVPLPVDGRMTTGDPSRLTELPMPLTRASLERGRQRFETFCAPCHAYTGEGNGMIVQRGFPRPPSLHEERLKAASVGYLYQVITQGLGTMPPYGPHVAESDRWLIVAYMRALQLSQGVPAQELSEPQRRRLEEIP